MVPNISIEEILEMKPTNIIDIRSNEKYNNNHIDNAINIPFEKLILNPEKYLDKNKKYFIYCQKGITSKKACMILSNKGYKIVNINGGYEEWIIKKN